MNKESVSILSIWVNIFLSVAKAIAGAIINSTALIADGVHSATDCLSSLGVYFGIKAAQKPIDKEHPYGHYAAETISGMFVVFLLALSGLWIVFEGIESISNQEAVHFSFWGIIVIVFSVVVNEAMARLKFKYGKQEESLALIADAEHSRSDAISSVGVLAGLLLVEYFLFVDGLVAIFIGMYILKKSYGLGKEVVDNLLGVRDEEAEKSIKDCCLKKDIVISSVKTRKIGAAIFAEIVIELDSELKVNQAEEVSQELQRDLISRIKNLKYVVIQIKSHQRKLSLIKQKWGRGMRWKGPFVFRKDGYRTVIPFYQGKFYPDFGSPGYLMIDKKDNKITSQEVKNPYFESRDGRGVRFIRLLMPDEIIVKKIGEGARGRLKEMGVKIRIISNEAEVKEILDSLTSSQEGIK